MAPSPPRRAEAELGVASVASEPSAAGPLCLLSPLLLCLGFVVAWAGSRLWREAGEPRGREGVHEAWPHPLCPQHPAVPGFPRPCIRQFALTLIAKGRSGVMIRATGPRYYEPLVFSIASTP